MSTISTNTEQAKVQISKLDRTRTQLRVKMSPAAVEDYADEMKNPKNAFPPILVFRDDDGTLHLVDGYHRCAAAEQIGRQHIAAEIRSGSPDDAILEAGEKRLRPILMTTFAMIGAMIPLAFGGGAGHESNAPMALAIIGGLMSSTILTLLVVPAIYRIMYPMDAWLRKWYEKGKVV